MKIIRIEQTTSTMDYVRKFIKKGKNLLVVAKSQTCGRGTKNREFSSNNGGIYLSRLEFYDNLLAKNSFSIIRSVSVAVVKTLLAFNVKAQIKWPNDILVNGKKICGILTENQLDGEKVCYSIVGIGLNVENQIPTHLEDVAISMKQILGSVNFEAVLMTLIFNLSAPEEVGLYKRYSCVLGKEVTIISGEREFAETVVDILDDGRILLSNGEKLSAGEIKLNVNN